MRVIKLVSDAETTHVDPMIGGVASWASLNYARPDQTFYMECRVADHKTVDPGALKVNGFTEEQVRDPKKPSEEELTVAFFDWAMKQAEGYEGPVRLEIAGENPRFDTGHLRAISDPMKLEWIFGHRTMDLHSVVQGRLEELNPKYRESGVVEILVNTDIAIEFTGLELRRGPHTASEDVKLEAEAFSRALRGRGLINEYEDLPIPGYLYPYADMRLRESEILEFCRRVEERESAKEKK